MELLLLIRISGTFVSFVFGAQPFADAKTVVRGRKL
jgi:hypothetical protein